MRVWIISFVALCLFVSGCKSESTPESTGPAPESNEPSVVSKTKSEKLEAPVKRSAAQYAKAMAAFLTWRDAQEERLDAKHRKEMTVKVSALKNFRVLAMTTYASRSFRMFTSQDEALSSDGELAAQLILEVVSHGLKEENYPLAVLRPAMKKYREALQGLADGRKAAVGGPSVLKSLLAVMLKADEDPENPKARSVQQLQSSILAAGLDDTHPIDTELAALKEHALVEYKTRHELMSALSDIDISVVTGFFRYAVDFRHLVAAHPFNATALEKVPEFIASLDEELLKDLEGAGDELGNTMKSWWPAHPYYQKARVAYMRYRKYTFDDSVPGWKVRKTLKRGRTGDEVVLLRKRLAAEGYLEGDLDSSKFDKKLAGAVKAYQSSHQLKADGIVRDKFGLQHKTRKSLGVSMNQRARQLRLSLQRWRESPIGKDPFYFRVNVPQFEVEVWEGDTLLRMHRVIVGNNKMEIDHDKGRKGYLNRTALISNHVKTIVINPIWNIPDRIRIYELEPELEKDPEYYQKHGYMVRELGGNRFQIFQTAGPGNALGRVKLLFPNKHSIYMHDTPKRRLFNRTIRTFSHGCMRLDKPIEMASFLLARQGIMDETEVKRILDRKKERGIRLKEAVPIHIEYNTIAFKPDGEQPIFLNDTYKYDRAYWKGELPIKAEEKIPVVKKEGVRPLTAEERAAAEAEAAKELNSDGEKAVDGEKKPADGEKKSADGEKAVDGEKKPADGEKAVDGKKKPADGEKAVEAVPVKKDKKLEKGEKTDTAPLPAKTPEPAVVPPSPPETEPNVDPGVGP